MRRLFARCYPGRVAVVAVPTERTPKQWLTAFVRESAGWAKAGLSEAHMG